MTDAVTGRAALAEKTILRELKRLGYSDDKDSIAHKNPSDNMSLNHGDDFFRTIEELGVTGKDVLVVGGIPNPEHFKRLLLPVRSLEVVNFEQEPSELNGHRHHGVQAENGSQRKIAIYNKENSKDIVAFNLVSNRLEAGALSTLVLQALEALRPGGHFVMREYLNGSLGGTDRYYFRTPAATCALLNSTVSADGKNGLQLEHANAPEPDQKSNTQEMTWLYKKVDSQSPEKKLQEFLDAQQYSIKGILKYEKIFGYRYVSTGGEKTTSEFCQLLDLKAGQRVLDVGCGIGGSAFYMAQEYGVHVHGVDLSSNMISIAVDRRREGNFSGVDFEIANILTRDYPPASFDVIYSRDVILHIEDKKKLFSDIFRWLKPGGKLFVTDYCCGDKTHNEDFKEYVKQRGYILLTVADYGELLSSVGFINVRAEDRTTQFVSILHSELREFQPQRAEFLEEFSEENYNEVVDGWNSKVKRCHAGDQCWGMFLAQKPL